VPYEGHRPKNVGSVWAEIWGRRESLDIHHVDVNTLAPQASQDGSAKYPFATIQGCLDAIGAPASAAEEARGSVIEIAPGVYEEDLVIPAGRFVLRGSNVQLGTALTPRGITYDNDPTAVIAALPGLAIIGVDEDPTSFIITGDIVWSDTGAGQQAVLLLKDVDLSGDLDGSAKTSVDNILRCDDVNIVGDVDCAAAKFDRTQFATFGGDVEVDELMVESCWFGGDITVGSVGSGARPALKNCDFDASPTFTGPDRSFLCDSYTFSRFKAQAGVLAGNATFHILDASGSHQQTPAGGTVVAGDAIGATTEDAVESIKVAAGDINQVGIKYEIEGYWRCAAVNGADTWTGRVRFGGVAGPPPTGTLVLTIPAHTPVPGSGGRLAVKIIIQSVGAGGTFDAHWTYYNEVGAVVARDCVFGAAVDTTGTGAIVFSSEWSTASADNQMVFDLESKRTYPSV